MQTVVSAVLILAFWATTKDPANALYVLLAILGTMAILVVQAVCSFAVLAYFRKNHPESRQSTGSERSPHLSSGASRCWRWCCSWCPT